MIVRAIASPPSIVSTGKISAKKCAAEKLLRISNYTTGEPYFGQSGVNRFDAPGCLRDAAEFSACYLGMSLSVALAESVLHDEMPIDGHFVIDLSTLEDKYVLHFSGSTLNLADLTGAALKRLGGHGELSGTANYQITQAWSHAVFQNPAKFDGFIYMSRHLNTEKAVMLFDRARSKIRMASAQPLLSHPQFAHTAKKLGIRQPR